MEHSPALLLPFVSIYGKNVGHMIWSIYTFIIYLMAFIHTPGNALTRSDTQSAFNNEAIGVRTFQYQDGSRNRPVIVEFWYPTDEVGVSLDIAEDSVWIHPKEARNVEISSSKRSYPLILMSHGYRGDRREGTWLVDALVRQGYVVASVEHHGNTWHHFNPLSGFCFWDRAKDISFSITRILEEQSIKDFIDKERIGFVGYSMGGMTGLALAGAKVKEAKQIAIAQQGQTGLAIPPEALNQIDFSEAEKNYKDERIKSILLICPATFAYLPDSLKQIRMPIGLIASIDDELLPHREHANKIIKSITPYKLKLLRNKTSHYAFLNKMTEKGYQILQKTTTSASALNWAPIHKEATSFAIKFFKETLPPTDNK